MGERQIPIEGIEPAELYGTGNSYIKQIAEKFPKLKVVARGATIRVIGEPDEAERFEKKLNRLIGYYGKFGHLSPEVIDQVFDGMMTTDNVPVTSRYSKCV